MSFLHEVSFEKERSFFHMFSSLTRAFYYVLVVPNGFGGTFSEPLSSGVVNLNSQFPTGIVKLFFLEFTPIIEGGFRFGFESSLVVSLHERAMIGCQSCGLAFWVVVADLCPRQWTGDRLLRKKCGE